MDWAVRDSDILLVGGGSTGSSVNTGPRLYSEVCRRIGIMYCNYNNCNGEITNIFLSAVRCFFPY